MTDETQKPDPMMDKPVTLTYAVGAINDIINMMNRPFDTTVMAWANLISNIQAQCAPQIEEFNKEAKTDEQPAE